MNRQYIHSHPLIIVEKYKSPYFLRDPRLTPWQNFCSETLSSNLVHQIFYPIDVAQILMQTNSSDSRDGLIPTLTHLYSQYGISGLYRGNIASTIFSGLFGLLGFGMKSFSHRLTSTNKILNFIMGAAPAHILLALLYPLQTAKIRMISHPSKYPDLLQTLQQTQDEEGLLGHYKGFGWTFFEYFSFMATSYAGYEVANLIIRKPHTDLTLGENLALATIASLIGTILHYPFDTAKKIVQSRKYIAEGDTVIGTLMSEGEKHGMMGLFRGLTAHLCKFPQLALQRFFYHNFQLYFLKANGITDLRHPILTIVTPVQV